jgi:hypothetical protein
LPQLQYKLLIHIFYWWLLKCFFICNQEVRSQCLSMTKTL